MGERCLVCWMEEDYFRKHKREMDGYIFYRVYSGLVIVRSVLPNSRVRTIMAGSITRLFIKH